MFDWLDARKAKDFGKSMAEYFIEHIPSAERNDEKKFARKTNRTLDAVAKKTIEFRKVEKLNVYKRAQLVNQFKWTLKEAGFPDNYIDKITLWLVKLL